MAHRLAMSGLNHEGTETVDGDFAIDGGDANSIECLYCLNAYIDGLLFCTAIIRFVLFGLVGCHFFAQVFNGFQLVFSKLVSSKV